MQCHNLCEVKKGPYAYKGKGPEYESFAMMGFNTMVDDLEAVAYACELAESLLDGLHFPGGGDRLGDGVL
jgi:aldehyde:ferredoxin oxidoreductase